MDLKRCWPILCATAAFPLMGCVDSDDGSQSTAAGGRGSHELRSVSLTFEGRVGSRPFQCGATYEDVGTSHATVTAGDLRFFVHGIRFSKGGREATALVLDERDPWQGSQVGLVDLEDKTGECAFGTSATNASLSGLLPVGDYDEVAFEVGVPDPLNHVNVETAGSPFAASKLQWDWANGFVHFASQLNSTELVEDESGQGRRVPSFYAHLGSTECAGAASAEDASPTCSHPNRPSIHVQHFDPTRDKIVVDLAQLFRDSNLDQNTENTIPGCMSGPSDPECQAIFEHLGLDWATGELSLDRPQTVFSRMPQ